MRKNMDNKGMSVTIAAVMLVGVTVALTLAVSGWVGAFTFQKMETESLVITGASFQGTSGALDNQIIVRMQNSGAEAVTLIKAKVTGYGVDKIIDFSHTTLDGGEYYSLTLDDVGWQSGHQYQIEFLSSKGNKFQTRAST